MVDLKIKRTAVGLEAEPADFDAVQLAVRKKPAKKVAKKKRHLRAVK